MRTCEEQLATIEERACRLRSRQAARRSMAAGALATMACMVGIVVAAIGMSQLNLNDTDIASGQGSFGSLILNDATQGYVLIGALSFLLGACVTLLCVHLHDQRKS